MNWKTIMTIISRIVTVIAAAFFVSLACMNAYATSDLEFSNSKALGVGGAIFVLGVIGFGLYMYNLSNPYRQAAKRRKKADKKTAKRSKMSYEDYLSNKEKVKREWAAACNFNPRSGSDYDTPLGE